MFVHVFEREKSPAPRVRSTRNLGCEAPVNGAAQPPPKKKEKEGEEGERVCFSSNFLFYEGIFENSTDLES